MHWNPLYSFNIWHEQGPQEYALEETVDKGWENEENFSGSHNGPKAIGLSQELSFTGGAGGQADRSLLWNVKEGIHALDTR